MNSAQPIVTAAASRRAQPRWHWWLLSAGVPLLVAGWPVLEREQRALAVTLLYAGFCAAIWLREALVANGQRPTVSPGGAAHHDAALMTLVAYASQSGSAQRLAELTAQQLRAAGEQVVLQSLAQLRPDALPAFRRALFVVSTYGEGEAPDSGSRFERALARHGARLERLDYAVLALGDRHYRDFCAFGRRLAARFAQLGARPLGEPVEIDAGDEAAVEAALGTWRRQLGLGDDAGWQLPDYQPWRLIERRHLNPGSPGEPVFHLVLQGSDTTTRWQAGDIAEVLPPGETLHREYSIASLPVSGFLELIVRQQRRADGGFGSASGWLTAGAAIGTDIPLRVRSNPMFHPPAASEPLILIGSGTGWAGLRAQLQARPAGTRNWLLFGERSLTHDNWVAADLTTHTPPVERIDLVFSRASHAACAASASPASSASMHPGYVQEQLHAQAGRLQTWIDAGAAIYVCGAASGMGEGVDATLRELLGEQLDELAAAGRYRRDIY